MEDFTFTDPKQLEATLESLLDKTFPGKNYGFGLLYNNGDHFKARAVSVGFQACFSHLVTVNRQSEYKDSSEHFIAATSNTQTLMEIIRTLVEEGLNL